MMNMMKLIVKILSITTFVFSTATVASIFYEGMLLQWFSFVGIFILLTDIFFLLTTIVGLFYYKNIKSLYYFIFYFFMDMLYRGNCGI